MNRDVESEKVHFFVNTVKAAGSVIMPYVSVNPEKELLQTKLKELAEEISEDLSALEAEQGKELLSDFVSDLFLAAAKRRQQQERRRRQAEGIAAAKARGVRFGRAGMPAPETSTASTRLGGTGKCLYSRRRTHAVSPKELFTAWPCGRRRRRAARAEKIPVRWMGPGTV